MYIVLEKKKQKIVFLVWACAVCFQQVFSLFLSLFLMRVILFPSAGLPAPTNAH